MFSNLSCNCFSLLLSRSKQLLLIGMDSVEWIVDPLMLYAATPVGAITRTGVSDRFPDIDRSRCRIALIRYDLPVPAVPMIMIRNAST